MKFSVAIPSYNRADCLRQTLEAILEQTLAPAEIVVVDDGSTDQTQAILSEYSGRVRSIRIENSGPGVARKTAIELCSNDWIALCDSDDLWIPEYLERKAATITRFPGTDFCLSNFTSFGPSAIEGYTNLDGAPRDWLSSFCAEADGDFVRLTDAYRAMLRHNPAYPSGIAFSRDLYERCGGIDPRYSRWLAEDAEFTRRLALHSELAVLDRKVCWHYRRHPSNFSASSEHRNILASAQIVEKQLAEGIIPDKLKAEVADFILRRKKKAFLRAYWEGCDREALNIARQIQLRHKAVGLLAREAHCRLRSILRRTSISARKN